MQITSTEIYFLTMLLIVTGSFFAGFIVGAGLMCQRATRAIGQIFNDRRSEITDSQLATHDARLTPEVHQ